MIETVVQFEANIDDMDPRLWPHVLDQLLDAGALDAWATPILMKKGRPAFTLAAMCFPDAAELVRTAIFRETTTIGIRETTMVRHVLDRTQSHVTVKREPVGVKRSTSQTGDVQNVSVEWDDVVAAAAAAGLSAKQVLGLASAAAHHDAGTEEK